MIKIMMMIIILRKQWKIFRMIKQSRRGQRRRINKEGKGNVEKDDR